jgi:predicted nucleic acid-binding protein
MSRVVVDSSVAVAWYVDEHWSREARILQAGPAELLAPPFLLLEVANVLVTRLRTDLPVPPGAPEVPVRELQAGGIAFTPDAVLRDSAVTIARRHLHPVYECLYLALARREEAMLATFDRRLAALAESLAIPLWSPDRVQEAP